MDVRYHLHSTFKTYGMFSSGFLLSIVAGTCASLASVCSKLALEEGGKTLRYIVPCARLSKLQCTNVLIIIRCLCILLMLLFNALMWNNFVKALQKSRSTVAATVINSATNFFCTAILGKVIFGETLALLWWLGASCIVFGLIFLNYASSELETTAMKKQH